MAQYHLKNLYYKYVNILLPKSLSDIYNYANSFEKIGQLARAYEVKIIVNEEKKYLEHKHIIFYTVKRRTYFNGLYLCLSARFYSNYDNYVL